MDLTHERITEFLDRDAAVTELTVYDGVTFCPEMPLLGDELLELVTTGGVVVDVSAL